MIHAIPVRSISFDDSERQREDLGDVASLAESIKTIGLINPIIITQDHILVAGRRRLQAHIELGFDLIEARYWDEVDAETLQIVELEENVKRKDLTWQEHVRAVSRFHDFCRTKSQNWTIEKTAQELNMAPTSVREATIIVPELEAGTPEVVKAARYSEALNFTKRKRERQAATVKRDTEQELEGILNVAMPQVAPQPADRKPEPARSYSLYNMDFIQWARDYEGEPFNLLHCDFPYGVSAGNKLGQSGAKILGGYEDSPDIYWNLISALKTSMDKVVAKSAHLIFWYGMKFHSNTITALTDMGWTVNPYPLIWHKSDNTGVLPDPERGPRRTYETALFASRGDRKIVRAVANSFSGPTSRVHHMSEKPLPVLSHFFRMLVDESTTLLDPTCGSGNAVKAAEQMGARYSCGLEISKEYFERAKGNLEE